MNLTKQTRNSGAVEVKRALRWDLVGLLLAFVIAIALISVLDTGSLAEWVAKHKESKIDEVIVASITLLIGVSFFLPAQVAGTISSAHQIRRLARDRPRCGAGGFTCSQATTPS